MTKKPFEINFISDKLSSFFTYLIQKDYFNQLPLNKDSDFFQNVQTLYQKFNHGQMQTKEELTLFIDNYFLSKLSKTDHIKFLSEFEENFKSYSQFYDKHLSQIAEVKKAYEATQKLYTSRLKQLYMFLGLKPDFKCHCILTPVPFKSIDGEGNSKGFFVLFLPNKINNGDSLLPERKKYVPLHEAGHVLFANSGIRRHLTELKGLGAKKLILTLSKYFYENPEKKLDKEMVPAWNALRCIDEAVAVFSASISSDKVGYYGWETADTLSKHFYPIANRYIRENKPLDDKLYAELAVSFEQNICQKNMKHTFSKQKSMER